MHRQTVSRPTSPASRSDSAVTEDPTDTASSDRQPTVSELVRNYSDPPIEGHKRDRSESGDPAPAGKRGARERGGEPGRSPASVSARSLKESLDDAIEGLENRVMASLSRDLHEFRETLMEEIGKLSDRVKDLEKHIEERDGVIDQLTDDLHQSRREVSALQDRVEEAEINSRLPCLILSGPAMAPRHAPRLDPSLPARAAPAAVGSSPPAAPAWPAGPGQGQVAVTSGSADRRASADERGPGQSAAAVTGGARRVGGWEEREDMNGLVVNTLKRCMPGLSIDGSDIDRAHRLPGPNNRVIVRFVRSGQDSVRDNVMTRRLELRGKDLYINESLTRLRGQIFRSLLAAKRQKKIYTVYSRGGYVFFKEKQHGVGTRVDSLQRLRDLGYGVLER